MLFSHILVTIFSKTRFEDTYEEDDTHDYHPHEVWIVWIMVEIDRSTFTNVNKKANEGGGEDGHGHGHGVEKEKLKIENPSQFKCFAWNEEGKRY